MIISENLGIGSVLGLVVRTVMYAGFFHWIFNEPTLVMTIPDSLSDLSGMVMGLNGKPDIFLLMDMGNMIYGEAMYKGSMLGGITGIDGLLVAILASVSQVLVYMIVGVILMLQIEIYMVTLCGFVLLIFAGLIHIFVDYAMMYVRALINCGLKYFVCGVVVGVIYKFSVQLFSMLATPDMAGLYAALTVIIGTFAVLYQIVKNISGIVSVILGGAPSIGNGVVPMMTGIVIGGANKAASITKAGAGKAVSGVLSMISSAFSGVNITKPDSDGGDTTKSQISEATGE
ncbi:hypothetical protein FACS1894187_19180 [Synergistales bacterium]|nr:hypothetical protein FACS1894187_19180 [Synergistales bacterium]